MGSLIVGSGWCGWLAAPGSMAPGARYLDGEHARLQTHAPPRRVDALGQLDVAAELAVAALESVIGGAFAAKMARAAHHQLAPVGLDRVVAVADPGNFDSDDDRVVGGVDVGGRRERMLD